MKRIDELINSKFLNEIHKAVVNIKYTSNYLTHYHTQFLNEYNISVPQFNILRILRGAKSELNVNTVKDRMIEKSPNTTRLMDKLCAKEFITRRTCEVDRRVLYIQITQQGLDLLAEIDKKFNDDQFIPTSLTDEEAKQLNFLLDKFRSGLCDEKLCSDDE